MAQTVQVLRTSTNVAPAVLAAGALSVELGAFTKLWVGAPAGGNRLLLSSDPADAPAAGAPYLKLSGGTLTGLLTLSGPPTVNLHAATKLYVDTGDTAARSYADTQDALRVAKAGDTMTGNLMVSPASGSAQVVLRKPASGQNTSLLGQNGANNRWVLQLGNGTAEGGSNAGSDLQLDRFNDAGTFIDTPLAINRASAAVTMTGSLTLVPAAGSEAQLFLRKPASGRTAILWGTTGANNRWSLQLGDSTAESAGAGSNFAVARYNDAGAFIDYPFTIARVNGQTTLNAQLNVFGLISINGANALWINGHNCIGMPGAGNTGYTEIMTPAGVQGLYLGAGPNPTNFYQNSTHTFRSLGATQQFAMIDTTGITVGSGATIYATPLTVAATFATIKYLANAVRQWSIGIANDGSWTAVDDWAAAGRLTITTAGACWCTGGVWYNISDERAKRNIADYRSGLAEILRLRPVAFEYNGELGSVDDGTTQYGLVAQEVEAVMPELVSQMTQSFPRDEEFGRDERSFTFKGVAPGATVYALINAVKELAQRVVALEGKSA